MTWIMVNVPIMVVFVALWVGIPTWLVLKHPDRKPALSAASAVLGSAAPPAEPLLISGWISPEAELSSSEVVETGAPARLFSEEPGRLSMAAEEPNAKP